MAKPTFYFLGICCASSLLFATSCSSPTNHSTVKNQDTTTQMVTQPDMTKVKAEIQAIATKWADAENARDARAVASIYADDAIRLVNGRPMISGKAGILKSLEKELANSAKGSAISIETLEVFGNEKDVIEVGRLTQKDSTGKVVYQGKYMTYWQNRNGKYLAMRDMFNSDSKSK